MAAFVAQSSSSGGRHLTHADVPPDGSACFQGILHLRHRSTLVTSRQGLDGAYEPVFNLILRNIHF